MAFLSTRKLLFASLLLNCLFLFEMMSSFLNLEMKPMWLSSLGVNTYTPVPTTPSPSLVTSTSMDAQEVKALKELITWPKYQGTLSFHSSTSPQNCEYHILHPKVNYSGGETLEVALTARDHQKRPKAYGGDFFRAKLHSPKLKAGVTGSVRDHQNGTYTVQFLLLWPGDVEVSIRLIHSSEAVQIMKRLRDTRPDKVYFHGRFQKNGITETTECNVEILNQPLCEYSDPRTGERWVCVRPRKLPCSTYIFHYGSSDRTIMTKTEDAFFHTSVTDQVIPGRMAPITVHGEPKTLGKFKVPICAPGLPIPQPSGFYYADVWTSFICSHKRFSTPSQVVTCLKGKIIYLFGDSTLRQWWEYLRDYVPSIKSIDLHVTYHAGPLLAVDPDNGLVLHYRGHGNPLRTDVTMAADRHYMANDIAGIGGGPSAVIVFTAGAHFASYPVDIFLRRLQNIRTAIIQLLQRSPQTTVIIKSANTGTKSIYGGDWLYLQLDTILRKMFSGLPVAIVDAWEMTSCHSLKDDIHPGKIIVQNEVDMFLSFICPN